MEYYERAGSAAHALPEERARFIRKTYTHLAFALLGFVVLEYVLLNLVGIENVVAFMTSGLNWHLVLGLFIVASWVAVRWARSEVSRGMQYAGLILYCYVAEGREKGGWKRIGRGIRGAVPRCSASSWRIVTVGERRGRGGVLDTPTLSASVTSGQSGTSPPLRFGANRGKGRAPPWSELLGAATRAYTLKTREKCHA